LLTVTFCQVTLCEKKVHKVSRRLPAAGWIP
jgi:hypothetical protein